VLVPWLPPTVPIATSAVEVQAPPTPGHVTQSPFENIFKNTIPDHSTSAVHSQFIRGVFGRCKTDVALFVDCEHPGHLESSGRNGKHHIFLPFFGGPDDRLALEFLVQLCANPKISATVLKLSKMDHRTEIPGLEKPSSVHLTPAATLDAEPTGLAGIGDLITEDVKGDPRGDPTTPITATYNQDTIYRNASLQARLESTVQDGLVWERYAAASKADPCPPAVADALTRIEFTEVATSSPLHHITQEVHTQLGYAAEHQKRLFVVLGRSRRLAPLSHHHELKGMIDEHGGVSNEVKRTIGDVATALVLSNCEAGLVVVQRAPNEEN